MKHGTRAFSGTVGSQKKTKLRGPHFPFGEAGWKPPTSKAEHLLLEVPKK